MTLSEIIQKFKPFIKYATVGVLGTAIDLGALYLLVEYAQMDVILASVLSFLLAVVNNFILNKAWTFQNKSKNYRKLFIKFLIVSLVGLLLTIFCMQLFVNVAHIWYMFAKVITSLIVLSWNFLGNKFWTFSIKQKQNQTIEESIYDLSIVIPAYNEENRIKNTLLSIQDYISSNKINTEIIVVNDGSKDSTVEVVKSYQSKIPNLKIIDLGKNCGKGAAVKQGVIESKGKLILFTDADNSTPIEEFGKLQKKLLENNSQIAIGSRYMQDSSVKIKQPIYRIFLGRAGNLLIRIFLIDGLRDTQCGFKLFTSDAAKNIFRFQKVTRFGFDMEALVVAGYLGYEIVEVPVSWFNSAESRVRPIKDAIITLKDLVYIKLNLWSGRYVDND
jgi:dolichyl-phosphate beta-glucosyltransferase